MRTGWYKEVRIKSHGAYVVRALLTARDALVGIRVRLDNTPGSTDDLTVYQDGEEVPHDASQQQGWDWNPGTNTLTFYGQSCDDIRGGQTEQVRIEYGCDDTVE